MKPVPIFHVLSVALPLLFGASGSRAEQLQVQAGDHVVIAGNTFAERMGLHGYFETLLYSTYPNHKLVVRNLGWSGDEVDLMPRSKNFGSFEEHLTWHGTDVIFLCFGMNESFAGEDGLPSWERRLTSFISHLSGQQFNGKSAPKLVLVSPIAQEDAGSAYPTGEALASRNRDLAAYTATMKKVATSKRVIFIDLFAETSALYALEGAPRITTNGIHLTERGDYIVSQMMARLLGIIERPVAGDHIAAANAEALRRMIYEKNALYFLTRRPLNPHRIWAYHARRCESTAPMRKLQQVGAVVRQLDQQIWAATKPAPTSTWTQPPGGTEMWETPIDHTKFTFAEDPPEMPTVLRDGAHNNDQ